MFSQDIYTILDQNINKQIKQVLDTENNKVIWERAIPTYDIPIIPTRNASLLEVSVDGVCTQNGTPTPDVPVDIMCNNGMLKINRLDLSAVDNGHYWSATGVYSSTTVARLSNTIPVKRGDVIAVTTETVRSGSTLNIRYNQFNTNGEWVSQSVYEQVSNPPHTEYITIEQDGFFNFSGNYGISAGVYVDWSKVLIINTTDLVFADGTPEVLTVRGVNLCASTYYTGDGWYVSSSDQVANAASNGTLVFPCKPNTTYSWWHTGGKGGARAFELTTDTVTTGQAATWAVGNPAYNDVMTVRKYTTSADAKLLCVLFARVDARNVGRTKDEQLADFMLVEGDIEEAFAYQPYVQPQTATAPDIYAVGNYADEVEIISGAVTRKVGIKVFDGTETFSKSTAYGKAFLINAASNSWGADRTGSVLCTHFLGLPQNTGSQADNTCFFNLTGHFYFRVSDNSDVEAFKTWLATQYAAGTPVIVLYPLAEETTESVASHTLQGYRGKTMVVIAQSEYVSGQNIKVKYLGIDNLLSSVGNAIVGTAEVW